MDPLWNPPMDSRRYLVWGPYGTSYGPSTLPLWTPMDPYGPLWTPMEPPMDPLLYPYGFPYGLPMDPYGAAMEPLWTSYLWTPYGPALVPIRDSTL